MLLCATCTIVACVIAVLLLFLIIIFILNESNKVPLFASYRNRNLTFSVSFWPRKLTRSHWTKMSHIRSSTPMTRSVRNLHKYMACSIVNPLLTMDKDAFFRIPNRVVGRVVVNLNLLLIFPIYVLPETFH